MMRLRSLGTVGLVLACLSGALASSGELVKLGRVLQQDISSGLHASSGRADPTGASAAAPSSGADASDDGPDVPTCPTPWEIFNASAELSLWAEALQTVGFADEVHSPYITATFLAPTNNAFAAYMHALGATKQQLLANPSIVPILLYHMIPGAYMAISDFALGDSLSTAINLNLTVGAATAPLVAAPGQNNTVVTVRSAQSVADIIKYNMTACMAMVHEIDQVLVPEFLGADSGEDQVVYYLGDGSGSHAVAANFTLVLPGGSQATSDAANPMYQITEAGLMFSISSPATPDGPNGP